MQESSLVRTQDGLAFRDLNKNGKLDIYEDPRQPIEARIDDLLGQMTLAEKAGMLFINGATVNADGSIEAKPGAPGPARVAVTQMVEQEMSHFNLWDIPNAQTVATWHHRLGHRLKPATAPAQTAPGRRRRGRGHAPGR